MTFLLFLIPIYYPSSVINEIYIEGSVQKGSISKIQILQEMSFCVLQVLLLDCTNMI